MHLFEMLSTPTDLLYNNIGI